MFDSLKHPREVLYTKKKKKCLKQKLQKYRKNKDTNNRNHLLSL